MVKLVGTLIANLAIKRARLGHRKIRLYTQKRAKDRSHKIYGMLSRDETDELILQLRRLHVSNPRPVLSLRGPYSTGVRFEIWEWDHVLN